MNRTLKALGIVFFLCFSFYYTHQYAMVAISKDPIYKTILMKQEEETLKSVDAEVFGEYIIPGLSEKKINVMKSFQAMKNAGGYLDSFLVFDEQLPEISTSLYKDKIIREGNEEKMGIAIILPEDFPFFYYFEENNINYTVLTTKNTVLRKLKGEKLNNDIENYTYVDKMLTKNKENKNICLVWDNKKDFCLQEKKTMVSPTIVLSNSNFVSELSRIKSGSIIYIKNLDISLFKVLVEKMIYRGYTFYTLSDLIAETR